MKEKEYIEFMYDPNNIESCDDCPENIGHNGHECNGHPCGQQNCWVQIHCNYCENSSDDSNE